MNNKITLPALIAQLALKSGLGKDQSEIFVQEFFNIISEALKEGENVKIKSLGSFKIMNVESRKSINVTNGEEIVIPGHKRIVFLPARELAEVINAPFSMFDSVELHPDAESELEEEYEKKGTSGEEESVEVSEIEKTEVGFSGIPNGVVTEESFPEPAIEPATGDPEEESVTTTDSETEKEEIEEPYGSEDPSEEGVEEELIPIQTEESKKGGGMKFIWGFITGLVIALALGAIAYWFLLREDADRKEASETISQHQDDNTSGSKVQLTDSMGIIEEQSDSLEVVKSEEAIESFPETKPSDQGVKDVIGDRYYLTTMAKKHYGNTNLWPYIYMENQDFIGHPDRITPGTAVIVPPLSKYGVDPSNPKDIEKAKKLGEEIYKRFR